MKIAIYTCLTDNHDTLKKVPEEYRDEADWICYTDNPGKKSYQDKGWELLPVEEKETKRRTARWYKINPQIHLKSYDWWIWLDASIMLQKRPMKLLKNTRRLSSFKHRTRDCAYAEGGACRQLNKGMPHKINAQLKKYAEEGLPPHFGMPETKCVVRKNTKEIKHFNRLWWQQIKNYSVRDQISIPYVMWKTWTMYEELPRKWFKFYNHKPGAKR